MQRTALETVSKADGTSPCGLEQVSFLMTDGFLHVVMTESCPCLSSMWASEELSTEGTLYSEQLESSRACLSENLESYSLFIPSGNSHRWTPVLEAGVIRMNWTGRPIPKLL